MAGPSTPEHSDRAETAACTLGDQATAGDDRADGQADCSKQAPKKSSKRGKQKSKQLSKAAAAQRLDGHPDGFTEVAEPLSVFREAGHPGNRAKRKVKQASRVGEPSSTREDEAEIIAELKESMPKQNYASFGSREKPSSSLQKSNRKQQSAKRTKRC